MLDDKAKETIPFEPYYDRDGITIFNADCKEVLPFLGSFDLLLTDPPYGIGADNRKQILSRGKLAVPIDCLLYTSPSPRDS